jgi:hypothetical protein
VERTARSPGFQSLHPAPPPLTFPLGKAMSTFVAVRPRERFALVAVVLCLALSTAYAFSIWNFLRVGLGSVSPGSVFSEHIAFRTTQGVMAALLVPGVLLYRRLRGRLAAPVRWVCFVVLGLAAGHLLTDCILRLLS